ncbi:hypothetical protein FisN_42Lh005 [Fistulifera solaris]|uniref:Uncharacterized protein n=1 Tax=Fistulifera solaris TaxID=1519565 RepID=A0A1Z5KJF3_FISSO|nr:hypothetical protein FisN_42Lh005 [Fistulifera solaris]|eukprot:GAX26088.1 hypothetical protein FisN_42Lh005 [Fistulifera solaris]
MNSNLSVVIMCRLLFLLASALLPSISAFLPSECGADFVSSSSRTVLYGEGTGGWGLGNSREMVPEEFARGERKAFEGYRLQDRGEFMRKVRDDKDNLKKQEMAELLGVASIAGINVKNPKDRLYKFDSDLIKEDDEDIDLSV